MIVDLAQRQQARGRILALEADGATLSLIKGILQAEGYVLRTTTAWAQARDVLRRESFDLVLTDLQPGEGDGAATARAVLALQPEQELFVTVPPDLSSQGLAALQGGAAGVLQRPVVADELRLRVNRTLYRIAQRGEMARLALENNEFRAALGVLHKGMAFLRISEIDRLGDLVLDTFMEVCRAESGTLWLAGVGEEGLRLRCRRGLAQVTVASPALLPESPEYAILYSGRTVVDAADGMLYVVLRNSDELIGLVRLESPSEQNAFNVPDLTATPAMADFATAAFSALLRVQRSEHDLLRTPGGEAYNMTFFRDHLEKKLLIAQRYGRQLSLIKLVVDNQAELVGRFHNQQIETSLRTLVAAVATVLREADIISQVVPGVYYLLLPETDAWGALMTQRRIRKVLSHHLLVSDYRKDLPIRVVMRSASSPADGVTLAALDRLIETRLAALRKSIVWRGNFEYAPFWQIAEAVLGNASRFPAGFFEQDEAGRYFVLDEGQLEPYCGAICREILGTQQGRGVALLGCADFAGMQQALGPVPVRQGQEDVLVYLLGGITGLAEVQPGLIAIHLDDPVFRERTFLLCLGDDYAYALFARRDGARWQVYHTADIYFVENMLAKLLEQYQLQTQL